MSDIPKRSYPIRVLGRKLSFSGPSNIEDVERLTTKNAVIEGYMQQYCFHDRGPELKRRFARKLEEFLGPDGDKQAFKAVLNDDGTPKLDDDKKPVIKYTESEKTFFNRVYAAEKITIEDVDRLLDEANSEIGDWSPGSVSQRKPAKQFYDMADEAMRRINDPEKGERNTAKFIANIQSQLHVDFADTFGDVNRDNVARAYAALDEKKREEAKAAARAAFDDDGDDDADNE
jgi:hypothetical protein